jgi:hypothetical protein
MNVFRNDEDVKMFHVECDILRYVDLWNLMETDAEASRYYFTEMLRRLDEFNGVTVELYKNSTSNEKAKVEGKIATINIWERLCMTLSSLLTAAMWSSNKELDQNDKDNLSAIVHCFILPR